MTLSDLLNEFNVVIDTAEGLTELRSLILGLAVRGKLVPQNPDDEPASELLKKIEAEKQLLYEEGFIPKPKRITPVREDEHPSFIPHGWEWKTIEELFTLKSGNNYKYNVSDSGTLFVKVSDMNLEQNKVYINTSSNFFETNSIDRNQLIPEMSIIFPKRGGAIATNKKRIVKDFPILIDSNTMAILTHGLVNLYYFFYWFQIIDLAGFGKHTAVPQINNKDINPIPFPLPPLAEQHRIVAKIEALFAEVDELEAKLNRQTKLDEKLQLAVNAEVQKAPDADASKSAWNFITSNFETLYHTPESIDNLKKNILNEAVRGRLVPQDPNDEPASELLKKIEAEKERLYEAGEIRKPKALPPVTEEEIPFEIPESWEWCRFGALTSVVEYGTSQKAHEEAIGIPVLRMGNISEGGSMIYDNLKYVDEEIDDLPRLLLKNDDLIFNRTNSYELVGKMGLYKDQGEKYTLASYLIRASLLLDLYAEYIHIFFNTPHCRVNEIEPQITKQTNQANFNGTKLQNVKIPLPPLEEQHRIVQRIEELFALCDRFKAHLEQRRAINEKLVKGLVQEVLEGV